MTTLVTKDVKGKIRIVWLDYEWDDSQHGFLIKRTTGYFQGKSTIQPDVLITRGKSNRTVTEQVKLEFNSYKKKYLDKGYKELPSSVKLTDINAVNQFMDKMFESGVTDTNGFNKHMLAKQADKCATAVFDKLDYWYGSRKIDGVRLSLYWDSESERILTASRGGGTYEYSTKHITEHPTLIAYFKEHPDLILDGELYKHGKSLQQISGAARLEKNAYDCEWLEYYIYDIMDATKKFEERLSDLHQLAEDLGLGFNPYKEWEEDELQLQMVPHIRVCGWRNIEKLHDKYVAEGWEGLVIRDPRKVYRFGGRTNDMIKIKRYKDAEFKITGLSEGLREEDMCFTLVTRKGIMFKAKPMGSRELKQQYRNDIKSLIGKMATVKYFYLSDDGTPLQPVLKAIRDYE